MGLKVNYQNKTYVKYYFECNSIRCHIDALHATPPASDEFNAEIVDGVIRETDCSGIISKVSRKTSDINRLNLLIINGRI